MMQVTKVWWDGEKLMAEPIDPASVYSDIVSDGGMDPRNKFDKPAQQEPVAWISEVRCVGPEYGKKRYGALPVQSLQPGYYAHTPLYTSPPAQRTWVGLTDEEVDEWTPEIHSVIRAIEAKLKERNT